MLTFIDVSGAAGQTGIDLAAAGVDGVFIKSAGANDGLYVAGGYATLLAKGRAQFGNVGHYFFNGPGGTPTQAADYWVRNVKFQQGDALALDVEAEGSMPAWTPDQAYEFCARVKAQLNVAPMIYGSAALIRSGDWSKCIALGCKLWVASYGSNNGSVGPEPSIGTQWAGYTMWQYTSTPLDKNLSRVKIQEIHQMTNSIEGVKAYARSHPTRDGGSWNGWCASFVYRAGAFSVSFINAMSAGDYQYYRGRLRSDWNNAPAGAIHYWAGVGGDGHVAFDLGNNILLMASGSVSDYGVALGTISFQSYANKQIPYRGWTMFWGDETLAGAGTAGGGSTPIGGFLMTLSDQQQADLASQVSWLYTNTIVPGQGYGYPAAINNKADEILVAVRDIQKRLIAKKADGSGDYPFDWLPAINNSLAGLIATVNPAALSKSISDAVIAALPAGGGSADPKAIAAAVDAALADNFAAIPDAVANEQADRLQD